MDFPKRNIPANSIPIDFPEELGYACPYNPKHSITWSEYQAHIWCYDCKRDYPSCFCKDNLEDMISAFYASVKNLKNKV